MKRFLATVAILVPVLSTSACGDDPTQPYFTFEGGGFTFNYRRATVHYSFLLRPMRRMADGTRLIVEMENPAGPPPFTDEQPVRSGQLRYTFHTPYLTGVVAGRPYRVVVRVLEAGGAELGRYEKTFTSKADQSALPAEAPFIGPAYERNPKAALPPQ
jgi:hypothetical protein